MLNTKRLKVKQRSRQSKLCNNVVLLILLMETWHGMINLTGGAPRSTRVQAWLKLVGVWVQVQAYTPDEHAMACTKTTEARLPIIY